MVQNEMLHSGISEVVGRANCPLPEVVEIVPFRMPRSDKGVQRGPRKASKPVKVSKPSAERGPGRPRVYNGSDRRVIAAALKKYGYTGGREFLRKERKLKVSLTLCRAVAEAEGITFKRGRPAA